MKIEFCANRRCLAPTARCTDGYVGPLATILCLEHMAIALGLPCDALFDPRPRGKK